MDARLKISTLGGLSIQLNGKPVTGFISRKVEALLIYLAMNPREHPREVLGELLWDDLPQSKTMSYLRTALSSLQKQLAPFLIVTRQSLAINPESDYWLDISEIEPVLDIAEEQWEQRGHYSQAIIKQLEEILKLYNGNFLDGFHIRNSRGFEGWMVLNQERIRNRIMEAFYHLGTYSLTHGNYSSGIIYTSRALELDPLWEEAHRQLMMLYAQSGQRTTAINQYEICKSILDEELGVEPEEETEDLYQHILDGQHTFITIPTTPNNLPSVASAFIARPDDVQHITHNLDNPECRLLTLVGTGGSGKTRLAIEVCSNLIMDYIQGVYFVQFAQVTNPNLIIKTIANALDIEFRGKRPLENELIEYLHDKEMLIVLDNIEHLMDGVDSLSRILQGAPKIKFLATSRERLNLAEEWLYQVEALPVPLIDEENIENYASVQLFVQSAKRVNKDLPFETNREAIVKICHLVQGLPLALELAASWVRTLTCDQIIHEIQSHIDFLTTSLRNVPERHRSISAVFESSWNLLSDTEKQIFSQLSVFRGSFDLDAAQTVTNASVFVISSLVDKSLLYYIDERYEMHNLLRKFANEKLDKTQSEYVHLRNKHSEYYANFIEQRQTRLSKYIPRTEYAIVLREYENIIKAWDHAVNTQNEDVLNRLARPIFHLFSLQNDYQGGEETFDNVMKILDISPKQDLSLAQVKIILYKAIFAEFQSKYDEAKNIITPLLPKLSKHNAIWEHHLGLRCLGNLEFSKSNYLIAKIYFEQAKKILQNSNEVNDMAEVLFRLSDIEAVTGNYDEAKKILEQSEFVLSNAQRSTQHVRYLLTLGDINYKLGHYDIAEDQFDTALNITQDFDSRRTMAIALVSLGRVKHAKGDYEEAREYFERSIDNYKKIRTEWGKAFALLQMATTWHDEGEYTRSLDYLRKTMTIADQINSRGLRANALRQKSKSEYALGNIEQSIHDLYQTLELATATQALPLVLDTLLGVARIKTYKEQFTDALMLANYTINSPFSSYDVRENAKQLLTTLQEEHGISEEANPVDINTIELDQLIEVELESYKNSN